MLYTLDYRLHFQRIITARFDYGIMAYMVAANSVSKWIKTITFVSHINVMNPTELPYRASIDLLLQFQIIRNAHESPWKREYRSIRSISVVPAVISVTALGYRPCLSALEASTCLPMLILECLRLAPCILVPQLLCKVSTSAAKVERFWRHTSCHPLWFPGCSFRTLNTCLPNNALDTDLW